MATAKSETSTSARLTSIDALRGFDMVWIMGADALGRAIAKASGDPQALKLAEQLEHVAWEGFRFYDLIFPLFLFLVGVVLPFSMAKYQGAGHSAWESHWRVARRTFALVLLGLIYNGLLQFNFAELRWVGVLQRIGICYGLAALAVLHLGARGLSAVTAILLVGYWALLRFATVSGFGGGDYSMEGNLASYVDRLILPGRTCCFPHGDNEGVLSTIPAVATALCGVLAGLWLKSSRSAGVKFGGLAVAGALTLGAGLVWGQSFPIIKNLWTSSFVMVTAGWSLLLLALFYGVIDGLGFKSWAFVFVVIGANAITIYVLGRIIPFSTIADFFVGGAMKYAGDANKIILWSAILILKWLLLLYLFRQRIFLRV